MTLAVFPLSLLINLVYFHMQNKLFKKLNLKVRANKLGLIAYILFFYFMMVPACIHGYFSELYGTKKKWSYDEKP